MIRILTKRVQAKTEAIGGLGDDQFGFRKGMGTRDAIGTLRGVYRMVRMYISALWIMKKHLIESNGEGTETDWRDRRLIGNLYMGQQMRVRIHGEYSEPGSIIPFSTRLQTHELYS